MPPRKMTDEELLRLIEVRGWDIQTDNNGQIIIYTGFCRNDDGKLVDFDPDEADA